MRLGPSTLTIMPMRRPFTVAVITPEPLLAIEGGSPVNVEVVFPTAGERERMAEVTGIKGLVAPVIILTDGRIMTY